MLNEEFEVSKSLAYEYVWATIHTKQEQLMIYYRGQKAEKAEIIKIHEYKIDETVKEFVCKF